MTDQDLLHRYNYDAFVPEKFEPWMRFDESHPIGQRAPDFPLWRLDDHEETSLSAIRSEHRFLVMEFGSFTCSALLISSIWQRRTVKADDKRKPARISSRSSGLKLVHVKFSCS